MTRRSDLPYGRTGNFQDDFESQKAIEDLVLASEVKTTCSSSNRIQVFARDGVVTLGAAPRS